MSTGPAKLSLSQQQQPKPVPSIAMATANRPKFDRRVILRGLGLVSGAAAQAPAAMMTMAHAYDPGPERRARYRETDHVKAFYRTNGYEALKK
jgi:hypothetical protein